MVMASSQTITLLFFFGCLGFVCLVFLCCICSVLSRLSWKTILGLENNYYCGDDEDNFESYRKLQRDLANARAEMTEHQQKQTYSDSRGMFLL